MGLLLYLPLFPILSLIYEQKADLNITYILIVLLWIFSLIATVRYLQVQSVMGIAEGNSLNV